MNKEKIFNILYGKETCDNWKQFKEIEDSIDESKELYVYFDDIKKMLTNENSHIKMRGFRIICKLSQWDNNNKINPVIDILLNVLDDDKPTIVRQCLPSLNSLLLNKKELSKNIECKLKNIDLSKYKDSMKSLIKKDIDMLLNQL